METKIEKKLRKSEFLSGCWIRLGNGEKWCVSPMPLGKRRKAILEKVEAVDKAQDAVIGKTGEEDSLITYDKLLEAAADLTLHVLQINYPDLTEETCDELCLVNIKHIQEIMSAVKGEKEIEEIINLVEDKSFGASQHDEGEQKKSLTTAQ